MPQSANLHTKGRDWIGRDGENGDSGARGWKKDNTVRQAWLSSPLLEEKEKRSCGAEHQDVEAVGCRVRSVLFIGAPVSPG